MNALDEAKNRLFRASVLLGAAHAQRHPIANLKVLEELVAAAQALTMALEDITGEKCCAKEQSVSKKYHKTVPSATEIHLGPTTDA